MRKIYTTIGIVLMASVALFAQKQVGVSTDVGHISFNSTESRAINDTLWPGDFATGTPIILGSANGGFVVGNNGYGDLGKGQAFIINNNMMVEGALILFGAKDNSGTGSTISVDLMDMDGTAGTTTAGADQTSPGTILTSASLTMADVDTAGMTVVSFTPTAVTGDFYIGIELSGVTAGDTLGIVSSTDGDGNQELTWEKWNDGAWYTMAAAWPLFFDFAIWAVVDNPNVGIDEVAYFNGIKAEVYPNPVNEIAHIVFDLETASNVQLDIVSITGALVYTNAEGMMTQGRHTLDVSVADLAPGNYFYSIASNGQRLTQKMVIK